MQPVHHCLAHRNYGGRIPLRYCGPALFQGNSRPAGDLLRLCRSLPKPDDAGNGGSASIALIKTSEMDALASAARDVFALNPAPVVDAGSVQYLELLPNHVFYDLEDYLSQFASGTSQFEAFQRQLAKRWSIRIIRTGFTAHLACITALTPSRVPVFAGSPPIFHVRIFRAIMLLTCKLLGLRQ